MSRSFSTRWKALAFATVTTAAALTASPAQADQQAHLTYACLFPLIGETQAVTVDIDTNLPDPLATPSSGYDLSAKVELGSDAPKILDYLQATSLSGTVRFGTVVNGAGLSNVSVPISTTIPKTSLRDTTGGRLDPVDLTATGTSGPVDFPGSGDVTATLTTLTITLRAFDTRGVAISNVPNPDGVADSDSDDGTFDLKCSLSPTNQNTVLRSSTGSTPTVDPTPTPTLTPTPTPRPAAVYDFPIAGTSTIKNLVNGTMPLTGSLKAFTQSSPGSTFAADLALNPSSVALPPLGILPVTATVAMVPTEQVVGQLAGDGSATATAKVRIKLPTVKTFGVELAGGANCQATQVSTIPLSASSFSTATGGTFSGTFAISDLSGCGAFTGLVSPLTAGPGNSIALKLGPGQVVG